MYYVLDGGLVVDGAALDENNHDDLQTAKRFDLNNWISFRGTSDTIDAFLYLRQRLNELMCKRLKSPTVAFSMVRNELILLMN